MHCPMNQFSTVIKIKISNYVVNREKYSTCDKDHCSANKSHLFIKEISSTMAYF